MTKIYFSFEKILANSLRVIVFVKPKAIEYIRMLPNARVIKPNDLKKYRKRPMIIPEAKILKKFFKEGM